MKFIFNGKPFSGVASAIVTPFDKDNVVDEEKLKALVNWQIEKGVQGLLVLGGSGEYVALSMEERVRAVKITVEAAAGRVPVIVGVLAPGIGESIDCAKQFQKAGANIPLVITPYYVSPSQEGIYNFYRRFDEGFNSPFLVYNIPYKNNTNIAPATFIRLAKEVPNCCGIKECSVNFAACVEIAQRAGDICTVMSGEDFLMGGHVMFGAEGAIIASANLIPAEWVRFFKDAKEKNVEAVNAFQKKYFPLFDLIFAETNPGPLKYAMGKIGMDVGDVSAPLTSCADSLRVKLDDMIAKLDIRK